jgi:hypothetical protein
MLDGCRTLNRSRWTRSPITVVHLIELALDRCDFVDAKLGVDHGYELCGLITEIIPIQKVGREERLRGLLIQTRAREFRGPRRPGPQPVPFFLRLPAK